MDEAGVGCGTLAMLPPHVVSALTNDQALVESVFCLHGVGGMR